LLARSDETNPWVPQSLSQLSLSLSLFLSLCLRKRSRRPGIRRQLWLRRRRRKPRKRVGVKKRERVSACVVQVKEKSDKASNMQIVRMREGETRESEGDEWNYRPRKSTLGPSVLRGRGHTAVEEEAATAAATADRADRFPMDERTPGRRKNGPPFYPQESAHRSGRVRPRPLWW